MDGTWILIGEYFSLSPKFNSINNKRSVMHVKEKVLYVDWILFPLKQIVTNEMKMC